MAEPEVNPLLQVAINEADRLANVVDEAGRKLEQARAAFHAVQKLRYLLENEISRTKAKQ